MSKIAIVEDSEDATELLKVMLANVAPARLFAFSSGSDFLRAYQPSQFDLLLLDIALPDVDGLTVLKEIRQREPALPVIAITAYAYEADREKAFAAGVNEYVTKPILDVEAFYELIRKYLKSRSRT